MPLPRQGERRDAGTGVTAAEGVPGRAGATVLEHVTVLALAAVAFGVCWAAGERGFFPLDQSIVFDAGWRVLSGQVPYRDFLLPMGPVVPWIQAAVFALLGVHWASYLATAAAMNAAATLLAVLLVRRLFPERRGLDALAGLVTAVWFYAPFGTPYFEQTAFLFGLAALVIALPALTGDPSTNAGARLAAAGALLAISVLSKQNAGILLAASVGLLVFLRAREARAGASPAILVAGAGVVLALFAAWLFAASDPAAAWHAMVAIPAGRGAWRIFAHPLRAGGLVFGGVIANNMIAASAAIIAIAVLARAGNARRRGIARLTLCLAAIQPLFLVSAGNDPENGYPLIGILFAAAVGLGAELVEPAARAEASPRWARAWVVTLAVLLAAGGLRVSLDRRVQNLFELSSFAEPLGIAGLERLRWGEPTRVHGGRLRGREVVELVALLRSRGEPFFVFPDFTMLYGLVGIPSPQPLLWFHRGLTYPESYDRALDERIVGALERRGVTLVVLERWSWLGTRKRLDDFPLLRSYLEERFRKVRQIGLFDVREKTS